MSKEDKARVIDMEELCKRHNNAMNNGTSTKFQITSIYNLHLRGFDRNFVNKVLEEYAQEGLISTSNDIVELTRTGKNRGYQLPTTVQVCKLVDRVSDLNTQSCFAAVMLYVG